MKRSKLFLLTIFTVMLLGTALNAKAYVVQPCDPATEICDTTNLPPTITPKEYFPYKLGINSIEDWRNMVYIIPGGSPISKITITENVDVTLLGNYTVTYTVRDVNGHKIFRTYNVEVVNDAPTVQLALFNNVFATNSTEPNWVNRIIANSNNSQITGQYVVTENVNMGTTGTYQLTACAMDSEGRVFINKFEIDVTNNINDFSGDVSTVYRMNDKIVTYYIESSLANAAFYEQYTLDAINIWEMQFGFDFVRSYYKSEAEIVIHFITQGEYLALGYKSGTHGVTDDAYTSILPNHYSFCDNTSGACYRINKVNQTTDVSNIYIIDLLNMQGLDENDNLQYYSNSNVVEVIAHELGHALGHNGHVINEAPVFATGRCNTKYYGTGLLNPILDAHKVGCSYPVNGMFSVEEKEDFNLLYNDTIFSN
ncbi:hypothetical protein KHQ81_11020 [Mycoplasmatota bacterium]|nr:hypothetical protein KHQ81_11020 [Mycoplasmatota bacterium]